MESHKFIKKIEIWE